MPGMRFLNVFLKILFNVCSKHSNEKHQSENRPLINSGRNALQCTGTLALIVVASLNECKVQYLEYTTKTI